MLNYPRIRDLHLIPYSNNGTPSFLLRDPLQLNGHMLIIPEFIAPLIFICDGTRDLDTVRTILDYHYGLSVSGEELGKVLATFDEAFLLDNERADEAMARALEDFRNAPFRTPSSAGGSYPEDPAALHRLLQDYLEGAEDGETVPEAAGLLSPHIDYGRGGEIYAQIWKRAAPALEDIDLFIVVGTDHYGGDHAITLTRQHYATPYGTLQTDVELVDRLAKAIGPELAFKGELFHMHEHSLELPLVWLHHMIGDRDIRVLPVLVGTIDPESEEFERFIDTLREQTTGRRVFTIISGDLAHVGPAFNGEPLDDEGKAAIRAADARMLDLLLDGDPEGFLAEMNENGNANNVCGLYPLYIALRAFSFEGGTAAGYAQCDADEDGTSIVSIGGILFK